MATARSSIDLCSRPWVDLCDSRTQDLRHGAQWPLDSDTLPQLYLALLRMLLQEQVSTCFRLRC